MCTSTPMMQCQQNVPGSACLMPSWSSVIVPQAGMTVAHMLQTKKASLPQQLMLVGHQFADPDRLRMSPSALFILLFSIYHRSRPLEPLVMRIPSAPLRAKKCFLQKRVAVVFVTQSAQHGELRKKEGTMFPWNGQTCQTDPSPSQSLICPLGLEVQT